MSKIADFVSEHAFVQTVHQIAANQSLELFLVGGLLRDLLISADATTNLGQRSVDFDFAVCPAKDGTARPSMAADLGRIVACDLAGHFVMLDDINDIARVVFDSGHYIDFAAARHGLERDLARRDFTINALAWSRDQPEQIIDMHGGLADLSTRTIRAISGANLIDDPLRLLRAYRFACLIDGTVEQKTKEYIAANLDLLDTVARERINYELFTMLDARVGNRIYEMAKLGLIEKLFPELKACHRVTPNSYHHLPLFEHCLETVPQVEAAIDLAPQWIKDHLAGELQSGITRRSSTKLACLLHDIGKPDTWQITEEGKHTFIGHDKLGGEMSRPIATREKWSRNVARHIEKLITMHLRPGALFHTGDPTEKAIKRFYRACEDDFADLMMLGFADLGATCGAGLSEEARLRLRMKFIEIIEGYPEFVEATKVMPRLLDGNALIALTGMRPGPGIGNILEAINEAQALKEIETVDQARAMALQLYKEGSF